MIEKPDTSKILAAALKAIDAGLRGNVVALFPDRGDRYFTKGLFAA